MKITTKVIGLLAVFAVYRVDAATPLGALKDYLHEMDKSLYTNTIVEAAKEDNPGDKVLAEITTQCGKLDPKIELDTDDKAKIKELVSVGVQDHQDRITPTALTGDVEYKFTYMDSSGKEEVKIKRKEITDLLGKMAKLRMTQNDLTGMLTVKDTANSVDECAKELDKKKDDLRNGNEDLLIRIVKLIKCLATENAKGTMYESLITQMVKDKADPADCLQAAHAILSSCAKASPSSSNDESAIAELLDINRETDIEVAIGKLTAPVLQAFTTLLFLQRTEKVKNGEVRNLNQYLITRGNARKVMKDTGGKLLLCDDISLEKSGLLALGLTADGITAVTTASTDDAKLNFGTDAYVLPAAVLLDDEGKPVVGTPVIPAPYLEYAINHNELVPANNIIVNGTNGVDSVLTTYGTSLSLKDAATVNVVDLKDPSATEIKGLSEIKGSIVPSVFINDKTKVTASTSADPAGKNTNSEIGDKLEVYGAADPLGAKNFTFDQKAATVIMNSLLANSVPVTDGAATSPDANIDKGPFYAGRIAADNCPGKNSKFTGNMLNSTAAIMLMSGKDGLRAKQALDDIVEVSGDVENTDVANRISAVSEYVIPGFDLDSNGDYVVTGLDATKIDKLDGKTEGTTSEVLKGKGRELLSAISRISKSIK